MVMPDYNTRPGRPYRQAERDVVEADEYVLSQISCRYLGNVRSPAWKVIWWSWGGL